MKELKPAPTISATEPDWNREKIHNWWNPSQQLLKSIRGYQSCNGGNIFKRFRQKIYVLEHRFWSVVTSADIPIDCQIGGGLRLTHPNGVVVHPKAKVGPNCLLLQQTTLVAGVELKGHVDVLAGAKIIKPVTIGEHAVIGANAVVVNDVPAYATAVGIPAKIIERKSNPPAE